MHGNAAALGVIADIRWQETVYKTLQSEPVLPL